MNSEQTAQIRVFINSRSMAEAVNTLLNRHFLKKRGEEDVNMKAARFIATELLNEAWLEMEKYRADNNNGEKSITNIGL
jgi:hypothetical protein